MTTPRSPEGELLDIMELDREIEQLRVGPCGSDDRALGLLLALRDDVDERAAALLGYHEDVPEPAVAAVASLGRLRRLAVVPLTGALVLASTGVAAALSGSPHAPLYPLHRLIFGSVTSSTATKVELDLTAAQQLLDQAAAEPYASRGQALGQAHVWLSDAQRLLPGAGSQTHTLSIQLTSELALLATLETPPSASFAPTGPKPSAGTDDGSTSTPSGNTDGSREAAQPTAAGESEAPETSVAPAQGQPGQSEPSSAATESSDPSWLPPIGGATLPGRSETEVPARGESDTPPTGTSPGTDR